MARTAWMMENEPSDAEIKGEILRQLMQLQREASIHPMDVARELFPKWREKMDRIKDVIAQMSIDGIVQVVTLRGDPIEMEDAKGQFRIKLLPKAWKWEGGDDESDD